MPSSALSEAIFFAALEKGSPRERSAYLAEACGGDAELRRRVERLLDAHSKVGVLDAPAITVGEQPLTGAGTMIGRYKLLEPIGEGGYGTVFMAEQTAPVQRRVALKIIKAGMDTRQVIARFEAERQALALMDHPNIAKVFDAGVTDTGRPYFVMELVEGISITKYCDEHRLPPRARLELFIQVCQAVQHAHQKGIIHRDLKPTNVLVAQYDGRPVPKVIDFGVAKATGQRLTDATMFTGFGDVIGTPQYMSPEQAEVNQLDVDTRSDIYSLGVLLYELLTGTTPLEHKRMKQTALLEVLRFIREEEPPKPSTRLSTAEQLPSIAASRGVEPRKLSGLLRGELDWIVMKALEKQRTRRYETANEMAMDVQRYLRDEAVHACPPSTWYRVRKFAHRHKAVLATACVIGLAVMVAIAVLVRSTLLIGRALRSETQAKEELRQDSYFHRIALAHRELSIHNLGCALELLDACPEDLRAWEWQHLQRLCRVDPVTLHGHGKGIRGVAFSPDGRSLAAANDDGTIERFDLKAGVALPMLRGHTAKVRSVTFHPTGTRLASASADCTVKVWDLATGRVVYSLVGNEGRHAGAASGVAFSPDGRLLAASADGGSVVLCDATNGHVLKRLNGHETMAVCLAFRADGRLLATGSWTGTLRVWDVNAGELSWSAEGDGRTTGAVAFSPDGRWIATAGYDRLVKLWDVATRREVRRWRAHDCIILGLAFSADGRRLATIGGEDKMVKLWDPLTGREVLKLGGHTFFGECVSFSPDGQQLVSSALDGTIRIWDASPASAGQEQLTLKHDDEVWSVGFSPDGRHIASTCLDKTARIWDVSTGQCLHRLSHSSQAYMLAFSRDGNRLASISRDKTAWVWDPISGEQLRAFHSPNKHLFGVTFSPDGQFLLVDHVGGKHPKEGQDHAVAVWDLSADRAEPREIGIVGRHAEDIWSLKFSPDGTRLASGSNDGTVKLWRWDPAHLGQPQEPLRRFSVRNYGFGDSVAFTPNGQRLVTVTGQTVQIWDTASGELLSTLRGHSGDVIAVAVSADGRWLASAGEDTTIVLWDAVSLSSASPSVVPRRTLRGHTGMVMGLAFSPDSRRLVSGSRDGTVKVWDITRWDKPPNR